MNKSNGGLAFPCVAYGPAGESYCESGMNLRQWYAGMAMQGILSDIAKVGPKADQLSSMAFKYADAMIAFEEKENEKAP